MKISEKNYEIICKGVQCLLCFVPCSICFLVIGIIVLGLNLSIVKNIASGNYLFFSYILLAAELISVISCAYAFLKKRRLFG